MGEVQLDGKLEKLYGELTGLTILEAADLVKAMEERLGISAAVAAPVAVAAGEPGAAPAEAEEKTSFKVTLKAVGGKKIQAIKAVREITSLGLKEAKALVDSAPTAVREDVSKDEAEIMKKKLEDAGATVEID